MSSRWTLDPDERMAKHPFREGFPEKAEEMMEYARHCHWWLADHRKEKGERVVRKRQIMYQLFAKFEEIHDLMVQANTMNIRFTPRPMNYGQLTITANEIDAYTAGIDIAQLEEDEARREQKEEEMGDGGGERKEEDEEKKQDKETVFIYDN